MSQPIEFVPGNLKSATKGISSGDLWNVPYEALFVPPGFNIREDRPARRAHIDNLKALILANGYERDKPLAGYVINVDGVDRVAITDGENRYIAVGELRAEGHEIAALPVVTKPRGTSMEDLTFALGTSASGLAVTPYELGTLIKRQIAYGVETAEISKRLNITDTYIDDLLFLHSMPKAIRDMVRTDKVAAGFAISTVRKHGDKAYGILKDALAKAEAGGRQKASPKDLPPDFNKEVKKAGPKLYERLMWVKEDPGYGKLAKETREYIEQLLDELPPEPEKADQE
jgi:ParB family transcriptional regulator, chromosome partitioning protein